MAEEEVKEAPAQEGAAPAESKKKKINKLSAQEIDKKLASLEEKKLQQSTYFKHLQQRKAELAAKAQ